MTFKLEHLWRIRRSIQKLVGQTVRIQTAYKLKKFVKACDEEFRVIDEHRNELIKKYGNRDSGRWSIPDSDFEALDKFNEEFKELLKMEITMNVPKVKLDDFKTSGGTEYVDTPDGTRMMQVPPLSIMDVANLEFLFEEEPEKTETDSDSPKIEDHK